MAIGLHVIARIRQKREKSFVVRRQTLRATFKTVQQAMSMAFASTPLKNTKF